MLRTALRPRWLALLAFIAVLVVAFVQLGRWQLGVAQDKATQQVLEEAARRPVVPLDTVLALHERFPGQESARRVSATGSYADGQVLIAHRRLDGREGYWVITPFRVQATGGVVAVLRGFVTAPESAAAPPSGVLTITGGLAPGESPYTGEPLPAGQLGSVDLSILVNEWPGDLYNAFLFLEKEDPASTSGLTAVPTPTAPTDLVWRNAAYAVQWWLFAGFAVWMWWRMVRQADAEERARGRATEREALGPEESSPPRPTIGQ